MTMHHRLRRGVGLLALLGVIGAATGQVPSPLLDSPPLTTLAGQPLSPGAWPGAATVVVFWSVDCAYCQRHNSRIAQLHATVDPQRLKVLGVAEGGDAAAARQEAARRDWRFPMVIDDGRLRARFTPRRVVPMTCLLAADGRLAQCIPGEMSEADVMALASVPWSGSAR
ncbi:TlpA disulfide reductase family protein [Ideonella oryzae]|uniref:TlpA family protein disulfide reductase n=1 Tax=Ideonella oryzae TaxID=2937441 RepID=A0ABT1BIL4_9BURK|nr:TlpA disulfide reductase family protein [Ideonella oryzae]MCO5976068.1 TlpA family protein disulfide reductase [Ideonella oryzae]